MEPGLGHPVPDAHEEHGRILHARLFEGGPTAFALLAEQFLPPLVSWLRQTYAEEDEETLDTIAHDLILSLGERPEQYDPDRLPLDAYLRMAARSDVKHAQQSRKRRAKRQLPLETVELRPPTRNSSWSDTSDPEESVLRSLDQDRVRALRDQFSERDWEVVLLMVDGERRTERFAEILGIQSWPLDEQAREVKRVKDRLKGRLKRLWHRTYGHE